MSLSVVIICHNEAKNLERTLQSVAWATEVIVVDSGSTDGTQNIAKSLGAKLIERDWPGYAAQKNFALDQATCDWVLSLDADEVVTPDTRRALEEAMKDQSVDSYYLARLNFFLGAPIRHGGWYPDKQLRLIKRGATGYEDQSVHERMTPTPTTTYLPEAVLYHYSYPDLASYKRKLFAYTALEAKRQPKSVVRNLVFMIFKPFYRFWQMYFRQSGFLDGWRGLLLAWLSSVYVFLVHWQAILGPTK